jgi:hypothetical protein
MRVSVIVVCPASPRPALRRRISTAVAAACGRPLWNSSRLLVPAGGRLSFSLPTSGVLCAGRLWPCVRGTATKRHRQISRPIRLKPAELLARPGRESHRATWPLARCARDSEIARLDVAEEMYPPRPRHPPVGLACPRRAWALTAPSLIGGRSLHCVVGHSSSITATIGKRECRAVHQGPYEHTFRMRVPGSAHRGAAIGR